jgi:hypothetical protein
METLYNIDKTPLAKHSLTGNIVPNAKRSKNFTYLPWRAQSDSLWGHLPYSSILQKTEIKMVFAKTGLFPSAFQLLSSRRADPCHPLCFDCWNPPPKQNQNSAGQWRFSKDHRFRKVSLCQQFKAIPQTSQSPGHSGHQQSSRPVKVEDVLFTQTSYQPSVRFGFFRSHPLWQVHRGSRSWLQSSQKRGSFLPSFTLFRISFQRLLAWSLKTWKRLYLFGCPGILQRMYGKGSPWHLSNPSTSRFRFFRSQIYRASGSRGNWLCHRSQDDPSDPKENRNPSVLPVQEKLGSSRVFLQTFPVEGTSSFCSHPPPSSRERLRTTDAFHFEALQLSGLCHQPTSPSRRDLVFLSAQSSDRGHHQGTKSKLCFGQDSNQQFPGQPVLFPSLAVRLQSRQLVQETLPTSKISECNFRDHSDRILSSPCEIGQGATPQCSQVTQRVYLQSNPGPCYPEYQKDEAIVNFHQFAKFLTNRHSE